MLVKTKTLIGHSLDWAVGRAQGWINYPSDSQEQGNIWHLDADTAPHGQVRSAAEYNPSTNGSQAIEIIGREQIEWCIHSNEEGEPVIWKAWPYWDIGAEGYGPTPLIAAMRGFAIAKMGVEVDLPQMYVEEYLTNVATQELIETPTLSPRG